MTEYKESVHETRFRHQLEVLKLDGWVRELEFDKEFGGRKWRFDFAWPEKKIAVEVHGKVFGGRHTRHTATGDWEKMNQAVLLGWRVITVWDKTLEDWTGVGMVEELLDFPCYQCKCKVGVV